MSTTKARFAAGAISVGVVAAVIAGVFAFGAVNASAEPSPSPTVAAPEHDFVKDYREAAAERQAAWEAGEAVRIAAEAEAARVAAEAAAAEAARIAAEQAAADAAAQQRQQQSSPQLPAGPIKCPPGSSANSGDGGNDTSCLPDICFQITLPDAAHPECDVAFRP